MNYLTREQILNADDLKTEVVDVKEWGGSVLVKAMTGKERDSFEASILDKSNPNKPSVKTENIRAKLVAQTVVDEKGKPIFTVADIEVLGGKSASALSRVYDVSAKLSKITADDVDELAKNSQTVQTDSSATN